MIAHAKMFTHDRVDRWQTDTAGGKDHGLAVVIAMQLAGQTQRAGDAGEGERELTVQDVNAALRRHIDPDRLYIALAGDIEKASTDTATACGLVGEGKKLPKAR